MLIKHHCTTHSELCGREQRQRVWLAAAGRRRRCRSARRLHQHSLPRLRLRSRCHCRQAAQTLRLRLCGTQARAAQRGLLVWHCRCGSQGSSPA